MPCARLDIAKSGAKRNAWGRLYCPLRNREGCQHAVYSTRVPEAHAR